MSNLEQDLWWEIKSYKEGGISLVDLLKLAYEHCSCDIQEVDDAYEEGYGEGYKYGHSDGYSKAEKDLSDADQDS